MVGPGIKLKNLTPESALNYYSLLPFHHHNWIEVFLYIIIYIYTINVCSITLFTYNFKTIL